MTATSTKRKKKIEPASASLRAARQDPGDRREQLLQSAIRAFAEHGLAAGNHAMVAAQAKVSVPTVFHYFANSDALVDAVLVEVERLYTMALLSVSELSLPPDQVLDTLTRTLVATIDSHPDHVQILTEWSISSRSPLWPRYVKLYRKMVRAVAKVIERGQAEGLFRADVNAEDEAAILYAVSRAFIQMKALGASPERFESFLRSVMQSVAVESKTKSKTGSKKATATLARLRKPSPASTKSGTSR